jgi:hypothetical protein
MSLLIARDLRAGQSHTRRPAAVLAADADDDFETEEDIDTLLRPIDFDTPGMRRIKKSMSKEQMQRYWQLHSKLPDTRRWLRR